MKTQKIRRRDFMGLTGGLGLLGLIGQYVFNPRQQLAKSMVASQIQQAQSRYLHNELSVQPARNLLQIHPYGGPSRWFFDHVLRPSDKDPFIPAVGVCNRIKSINPQHPHLSEGHYADVKLRGINMPFLWQFDVPDSKGGQRPMAELMNNMLIIRGCDSVFNAHPLGSARQVTPTLGSVSINGLVADGSDYLIPAIGVGRTPANRAFRSKSGIGMVNIPPDTENYISYLLEAFYRTEQVTERGPASEENDIEAAVAALQAYSQTNHPGAEILYRDRHNAVKLIRKGLRDLDDVFPQLEGKYERLLQEAMHGRVISGVNDQPIPKVNFPCEFPEDVSIKTALASHHKNQTILAFDDLREFFLDAKAQLLAKQFALAEFTLTEGLTSTLLLSSPNERGYSLIGLPSAQVYKLSDIGKIYHPDRKVTEIYLKPNAQLTQSEIKIEHDSHDTGWLTNIVACTMYYRGLSACLLEIIDQLKAVSLGSGNLFDETVIQVATEFDRFPNEGGSGLSHHAKAYVTSFFSGAIDRPIVLGNIYEGKKERGLVPLGTTGFAAPVDGLSNGIINMNNVSSSMSELLRVPRIVHRAQSLIEVTNSKIIPTVEWARNVEDEA